MSSWFWRPKAQPGLQGPFGGPLHGFLQDTEAGKNGGCPSFGVQPSGKQIGRGDREGAAHLMFWRLPPVQPWPRAEHICSWSSPAAMQYRCPFVPRRRRRWRLRFMDRLSNSTVSERDSHPGLPVHLWGWEAWPCCLLSGMQAE